MTTKLPRLSISQDKLSDVPKGDTDKLRSVVREKVVRPTEERAKRQSQLIATVRSRAFR